MSKPPDRTDFWRTLPLAQMSRAQWESLCDGCGRCCVNTLEDEQTGDLFSTCVACKLFDDRSAQCSLYETRHQHVPECITLTPDNIAEMDFLPGSCAYRLVANGHDLPEWHHLKCGNREEVHRRGLSVRGKTLNELVLNATGEDLDEYLHNWPNDPALPGNPRIRPADEY